MAFIVCCLPGSVGYLGIGFPVRVLQQGLFKQGCGVLGFGVTSLDDCPTKALGDNHE